MRREDLYDSSIGEEDNRDEVVDSALRDKLNAQLSGLFNFSFADTSNDVQQPQQPDDNVDQATAEGNFAFSFRLFRDEEPSHKVVLDRDEALEQTGGGGLVVGRRPTSYYVADKPSPGAMAKFRAAAVTSDYLFQDAKKRRWGLEKPWRVTTITVTRSAGGDPTHHSGEDEAEASEYRRKRPGKKRRIILRTRQKARKEREESEKQKLTEKEQHLKDKKKRLNREKKLKRRAKDREKKLSVKGDDGVASEHGTSRGTSPD